MNLLALETSGRTGSIALATTDRFTLCEQVNLAVDGRTAALLHPAIDDLLKRHQIAPTQIDVIAVAIGPGSFTGLRIGIVAAKTLAYAIGAKVVAVSTLDALALAARQQYAGPVVAMLNAQRGQYFCGSYAADEPLPRRESHYELLAADALTQRGTDDVRLIGPLATRMSPSAIDLTPQAAAVAELASIRAANGDYDDLWRLVPDYGRLSAAEEKLLAEE